MPLCDRSEREVMKATKRPDIQTIRAFAICAVLVFHLRPDFFPHGYLGVDIFFVLSGYLMSMMLSRIDKFTVKAVFDFYWRRIMRILPMYCIVICAVVIISRLILSPIDYSVLVRDTRWSLAFGANVQQYRDGSDYWAQVNDSPILLHMWSLGAEVQYYLVVPLIALIQHCFKRRVLQLIYLAVLALASLTSFLIFSKSNEKAAFLLMHNRVWQFVIGSLANEIICVNVADDDSENLFAVSPRKVFPSRILPILFISSFLIYLSPLQLPIRLPVSIITGLLLFYGSQKQMALLSIGMIVKLGDLSYVIYLVHWPVITLYKYSLEAKTLDIRGVLFCLVSSIVISYALHELIELKLLGAPKRRILTLVFVLYVTILVVTSLELKSDISNSSDKQYNYTEVVHWNTRKTSVYGGYDCKYDEEGTKWAAPYKEERHNRCLAKGNGTARVLIIGNSFAGIVAKSLRPMLKPMAKEIRQFAHHGCRILIKDTCPSFTKAWKRVVEAMKPDVTWIISREPQLATNHLVDPVEDDPTFQYAREIIDFISNHSKLVVLDYQSMGIILDKSMYPPKTILRRIAKGNFKFDDLKVTEEAWKNFDRNETIRMDNIKNTKLIKHELSKRQCSSGLCYFYNPSNLHVYFADNYAHPTNELLKLLRPSYQDVIEKLEKRLNN